MPIGLGIAQTLSVPVQRWLSISLINGSVTYQGKQNRPARVGDHLQAVGEGVSTGSRSSAILDIDTNIGSINLAENSELRIKNLQVKPNQGHFTVLSVIRGLAKLRIRHFTNPESRFEIETPAGVAGVRGTEFGVGVDPSGKTNVATFEGTVEAKAQGQTVSVEKGFGSIIIPGEPPTQPQLLTNDVRLRNVKVVRMSLETLEIRGQVDPLNLVWINGQAVTVDKDGNFQIILPVPSSFRLKVKVQTPLGKEANYPLLVPHFS